MKRETQLAHARPRMCRPVIILQTAGIQQSDSHTLPWRESGCSSSFAGHCTRGLKWLQIRFCTLEMLLSAHALYAERAHWMHEGSGCDDKRLRACESRRRYFGKPSRPSKLQKSSGFAILFRSLTRDHGTSQSIE